MTSLAVALTLAAPAVAGTSGQSLYLGQPSQMMVQPYVSVEVQGQTSPGVYVNYGPSSDPVTIDVFGTIIPISNAHNYLLLDTGANSILIVDDAAQDLENAGYQTEGFFWELGVGGYTEYDVSAKYRFAYKGDDGVTHYLNGTNGEGIRILSNPDSYLAAPIDSGGVAGIVGMPAMSGRVTTLDFPQAGYDYPSGPIETWDIWDLIALLSGGGAGINTSFSSSLPAASGSRYTVALDNRIHFSAEDGMPEGAPPGNPLPIYADVPFMTAYANYTNGEGIFKQAEGTFLLDTGAQFSMISRRMAFALGLDENGNGDLLDESMGTIEVAGVGGTKEVPIMCIEQLRLPTDQGVDLVWHDPSVPSESIGVQVIVLDLFTCADIDYSGTVDAADIAIIENNLGLTVTAGNIPAGDINGDGIVNQADLDIAYAQLGESTFIDGVFGIDMLTGGTYISGDFLDLDLDLFGTQFFSSVHFDFSNWVNGQGTLVFDVNDVHSAVTQTLCGDADYNGTVDAGDAQILAENWLAADAGWSQGDFNGDGLVNDLDAALLAANWGQSSSGASVPEPSTPLMLLALLVGCIMLQRYQLSIPHMPRK